MEKKKIILTTTACLLMLVICFFAFKNKEDIILEDEKKVANYLQDNSCFINFAFETFRLNNISKDFQNNTMDKLEFIRTYHEFFNKDDNNAIYRAIEDGPMLNTFLKEKYILENLQLFFQNTDLSNASKMENYYDIGSPVDGALPLYFPVLYEFNYDDQTNIYDISLIDYRSYDPYLTNYENITKINKIENASILNIKLKETNEQLKILSSEFIYKDDLSKYDAMEYREIYQKFVMTNDGILDSSILNSNLKLSSFLKNNGNLLGILFQTYQKTSQKIDYNNFKDQIDFILNLIYVLNDKNEFVYLQTKDQPMAQFYIDENYLKELGNKLFENFKENEITTLNKLEDIYYDVKNPADGGCVQNYLPILYKQEYNKKTKTNTLYIVNYNDLNLSENYKNKITVTEDEIKNISDLPMLQIEYKKEQGKPILISSNFTY